MQRRLVRPRLHVHAVDLGGALLDGRRWRHPGARAQGGASIRANSRAPSTSTPTASRCRSATPRSASATRSRREGLPEAGGFDIVQWFALMVGRDVSETPSRARSEEINADLSENTIGLGGL